MKEQQQLRQAELRRDKEFDDQLKLKIENDNREHVRKQSERKYDIYGFDFFQPKISKFYLLSFLV